MESSMIAGSHHHHHKHHKNHSHLSESHSSNLNSTLYDSLAETLAK